MKNILKIWVLVIAVAIIGGCRTPQKRLNRLITMHPELIKAKDTVTVTDTIVGYTHDTVIATQFLKDTVTITKENTVVKLFSVGSDSLGVQLKQDTIYKEVKVEVPVVKVEYKPSYKIYVLLGGVILLFAVLLYCLKK